MPLTVIFKVHYYFLRLSHGMFLLKKGPHIFKFNSCATFLACHLDFNVSHKYTENRSLPFVHNVRIKYINTTTQV